MNATARRLLIRQKLRTGRLPLRRSATLWETHARGKTCDGCESAIMGGQLVMEAAGPASPGERSVQLHVACFVIWDKERRALETA